ncbi:hypothetical protein [Streptosporangium sp. NPDC001681]|uniref:hypothetical protein n=1 Tax=Streptosporangium sp. NPDC001681 TaxID=3154395 RepID=UPI00332EFA5C
MIVSGEHAARVDVRQLVVVIDGEKFDARAQQRIIALRWAMEWCGPAASVDAVLKAAREFDKYLR